MKHSASLVFTGDIGFDRYMEGRWADDNLLAPDIVGFCRAADHVIANVEGAFAPKSAPMVNKGAAQLLHTMDPGATKVLTAIGADIWNLANNHIMDAGEAGLVATLATAAAHGAKTIGAGLNREQAMRPVILPEAGGIGLIAVGYQRGCKPAGEKKAGCFSWSDMEAIAAVIADVKKMCRWCVVVSHGGEEFTALPAPYTRQRYLDYLQMGADVVVCHHPHVPMNYERVGDKVIFYSLGNFIFDTDYQRAQYHTDEGVLLRLDFDESAFHFEAMGIRIDRTAERVVTAPLPAIFTDVPEEEYQRLLPLAVKMFVAATKRQQRFLYPERFANATEADWKAHFDNPTRSGRVPGEALDFFILMPIAAKEAEKAWESSNMEEVKQYILGQM